MTTEQALAAIYKLANGFGECPSGDDVVILVKHQMERLAAALTVIEIGGHIDGVMTGDTCQRATDCPLCAALVELRRVSREEGMG